MNLGLKRLILDRDIRLEVLPISVGHPYMTSEYKMKKNMFHTIIFGIPRWYLCLCSAIIDRIEGIIKTIVQKTKKMLMKEAKII